MQKKLCSGLRDMPGETTAPWLSSCNKFQESQQNSGLWPSIGLAHQVAF